MNKRFFLNILIILGMIGVTNSQSLNELLGYKDTDKLLIIHADDLGCAHAENAASFEAMKKGVVNSGSIIVPSPWFMEVVNEYKKNPHFDLGIHLAVTSEWRDYKWGPVSPIDKVKSLVNKYGYFYSSVDSVVMFAKPKELALEMENQIKKCLALGLDITHLDSHMGWAFNNAKFHDIYVKLSQKYKLPILYSKDIPAFLKNTKLKYNYWLDNIVGASPNHYPDSMNIFYINFLKDLRPGIHELIVHTAFDNAEMQAVCVDHPLWGALWRQKDTDFVMSEEAKMIIKERGIRLVTWREIRDKVVRR